MNRRDLLKALTVGGAILAAPWRAVAQEVYPSEFQVTPLIFPIQRMYCNRNANMFGVTWLSNTDGANTAIYLPFTIDRPFLFDRLFNITSSANGNIDIGVYTADYTKIVSTGSTAQAGSSSMQTISLGAVYRLEPGSYWCGIAANNTSSSSCSHTNGATNGHNCIWMGMAVQTTAFPLPSPMVPIRPATAKNYITPACGLVNVGW